MAIVHKATLTPSKLELLGAWLPRRPWYRGPAEPQPTRIAACRFDDPAGQVGIETMVVDAGRGPLHTPLTYRDTPLGGGEQWLIGTAEHSVLGRRWVYDACGDPLYAAILTRTILTGGRQAEEFVEGDGEARRRVPDMAVSGSGAEGAQVPVADPVVRVDDAEPTIILTGSAELLVARILDTSGGTTPGGLTLTGTWRGQATAVLLAWIRQP